MPGTKTFQDRNFLVWEVYTSGSRDGYPDDSRLIFHCLTNQDIRSRALDVSRDEADAGRLLADAGAADLLAMLEKAVELT